jgi:hypothetical protein
VDAASWNLLLWSETFAGAAWVLEASAAVTANYGANPSGFGNADRIFLPTGLLSKIYQEFQSPGQTVTFSIWLKSNTGATQTCRLLLREKPSSTTYASLTATVTTVWQRFTVTATIPIYSIGVRAQIYHWDRSWPDWDILAWGAMVNVGASAGGYKKTRYFADGIQAGPYVLLPSNRVPYSSDLTASGWVADSHCIQGVGTTGPYGGAAQRWKVIDTTAYTYIGVAVGNLSYDNVAWVYVKESTATQFCLNILDTTAPADHIVTFGWTGGILAYVGEYQTDGYFFESVGSGWYRIGVYVDGIKRGINGHNFSIRVYPAGPGGTANMGSYVWGVGCDIRDKPPAHAETTGDVIDLQIPVAGAVYCAGFQASAVNVMRAGDLVRFTNSPRVYVLAADASADAFGNALLQLDRPAPTGYNQENLEPATIQNVPITVALEDDTIETIIDSRGHYYLSAAFIEAVE